MFFSSGLAFETLAGVISLASSEIDQSLVSEIFGALDYWFSENIFWVRVKHHCGILGLVLIYFWFWNLLVTRLLFIGTLLDIYLVMWSYDHSCFSFCRSRQWRRVSWSFLTVSKNMVCNKLLAILCLCIGDFLQSLHTS